MEDSPTRYSAEGFLESSRSPVQEPTVSEVPTTPPRRIHRIAIWLAIATVLSTFWAGVGAWVPTAPLALAMEQQSLMPIRQVLLANWWGGLQFSLALMAILVAHELGHYVLTIVYRVPSTPPLFIPFPFYSPIGTMGAVIMMQSGAADRKQIFDIGLAGPLAGLVIALPVIIFGILSNQPIAYAPNDASGALVMGQPLLIQWLAQWFAPAEAAKFVEMANTANEPVVDGRLGRSAGDWSEYDAPGTTGWRPCDIRTVGAQVDLRRRGSSDCLHCLHADLRCDSVFPDAGSRVVDGLATSAQQRRYAGPWAWLAK